MSATSCGLVRRGPPLKVLQLESQQNPYCNSCSRFFYGQKLEPGEDGVTRCPHCSAQIVTVMSDEIMLRMTKYGGSELL